MHQDRTVRVLSRNVLYSEATGSILSKVAKITINNKLWIGKLWLLNSDNPYIRDKHEGLKQEPERKLQLELDLELKQELEQTLDLGAPKRSLSWN